MSNSPVIETIARALIDEPTGSERGKAAAVFIALQRADMLKPVDHDELTRRDKIEALAEKLLLERQGRSTRLCVSLAKDLYDELDQELS